MAIDGIPRRAFDFYKDLEADNTREHFHAHKADYETAVREPMDTLLEELEDEFGPGKLFRPQRDTRFSQDKSPYKTNQGATVGGDGHAGYYLQLDADGLYVGGGFHAFTPDATASYRAAVDDDRSGPEVQAIVDRLHDKGFSLVGDRVKTQPRGYQADHPRIELIRYKSLGVEKRVPRAKATGKQTLPAVRDAWRDLAPLIEWLSAHTVS